MRGFEGGEEPVACVVDLATMEPADQGPALGVVIRHEFAPLAVAQLEGDFGRSDDVGEEYGGQHPVELGLLVSHRGEQVTEVDQHTEQQLVRAGTSISRAPAMWWAR